ncbi:hypothetical protein [Rathayibacter soli]|uniref:hypothetical protein n=1 Tax=Rathayibacter soli TaxID=3144168 RepID=UPI0027E420B2|nr:hypothetical protein [Glaciibacter superstes]
MRTNGQLPPELGQAFSVGAARAVGTTPGRLRGRDLAKPFRGVRTLEPQRSETHEKTAEQTKSSIDPEEERRLEALKPARAYSHRMRECEFFSHETAGLIWRAPLRATHRIDTADGIDLVDTADGIDLAGRVDTADGIDTAGKSRKNHNGPPVRFGHDPVPHVSVLYGDSAPRARGVHGHRLAGDPSHLQLHDGMRVASPALTWVTLSHLPLYDLVAVGDYFARVWRKEGFYRVNPGMPPLASLAQLSAAVEEGRRTGIRSLRAALPLIRTDAWSRPETWTRLTLTDAGLPEPVLNRDQYDRYGDFLACVDLAYPALKIAIEYQGQHHAAQYARDIERVERMRAEGWIVIQVSSVLLFDHPAELVRRVRAALIERGWRD